MKREKGLIQILVAIFLALLIVILYPIWYPYLEKSKSEMNKESVSSNFIFKNLYEENTDEITIEGGIEKFTVEKTASGWMLGDKKASNEQVELFFGALKTLEVGDLLSKNPRNHLELGVSNITGYILTIRKGSTRYSAIIGNPSSIEDAFYIRPVNKDNVYLAKGKLRDVITQSKTEWLDKAIIDINFDSVVTIDVLSASPFSIVKKEDNILVKSNQDREDIISSERAKTLRLLFSPLVGKKFLNEQQKADFEKARFKNVVVFLNEDGDIIASLDILKHKDTWWVAETGSSDVFEVDNVSMLFEL